LSDDECLKDSKGDVGEKAVFEKWVGYLKDTKDMLERLPTDFLEAPRSSGDGQYSRVCAEARETCEVSNAAHSISLPSPNLYQDVSTSKVER
jgi:hypothetical protein